MNQIRLSKATAIDVKKAMRKLKLTKYIENFYYILFAVTGEEPPYIKRDFEDKTVRMFKMIDRVQSEELHELLLHSVQASKATQSPFA